MAHSKPRLDVSTKATTKASNNAARIGLVIGLAVVLLMVDGAFRQAAAEPSGYRGEWETTYGLMRLEPQGDGLVGHYLMGGQRCTIAGKVRGRRFEFTYAEPDARGEGWFELVPGGGAFQGQWRQQGQVAWRPWVGRRQAKRAAGAAFGGLWNTTYGKLRLVQRGDRVAGVYAYSAGSSVTGRVDGDKLTFEYREPKTSGRGWFRLLPGGDRFEGQWQAEGKSTWSAWSGTRVQPRPGRRWLVVIEARWEGSLAEPEYSFGDMLKAFFARSPNVEVRHRFFSDEASLGRWTAELAYLAEPTVVVIATHGTPEGLKVGGKTIGAQAIAQNLRHADNLVLLHFSACLVMKDRLASQLLAALGDEARAPVSGYTRSVDWAASAIIEFMYLDLVLNRGFPPATAAEQLPRLLPFAGTTPVEGAPFAPAGFRLVRPGR